MYEPFFSLEDAPFVLTPDPRFLLRSKVHHEILGTLIYGITSQKGLMALIGDVGTGKTTLCRAILRELPQGVQSALVLNPYLSDAELIGTILDDLGVERRGSTKGELIGVLSQYLLSAGNEGKTVVVILDEAQQMSVEALEQIRILSTLETATRKLLQIVLVGQPELEGKLRLPELRQLDQRIGIRCYLRPLSRKDTFRYVEHRMRIAGLPGTLPFARSALAKIHKYSRGIPRLINLVCDRALMAAYSARAREVTPAIVKTAIRNLEGERRGGRRPARRSAAGPRTRKVTVLAACMAGILILGGAAATAYWSGWRATSLQILIARAVARATPQPAPPAPEPMAPAAAAVPAPPAPAPAMPTSTPASPQPQLLASGGMKGVLAQALRLWGVNEDLSEEAAKAWPGAADGTLDMPAIAARYQLAATALPSINLDELRAVGLPAIVEVNDKSARFPYLLRQLGPDAATLLGPAGDEARVTVDSLESSWTRSAWIIWRNVDQLPADPNQEMTPIVVATVGLRLQKLGYLTPPLPAANGERFQQGVRRFQRAVGLNEDGIVGPRTTLALSRVVAGRFSPAIAAVQSAPPMSPEGAKRPGREPGSSAVKREDQNPEGAKRPGREPGSSAVKREDQSPEEAKMPSREPGPSALGREQPSGEGVKEPGRGPAPATRPREKQSP